jgi:hypothetical protein
MLCISISISIRKSNLKVESENMKFGSPNLKFWVERFFDPSRANVDRFGLASHALSLLNRDRPNHRKTRPLDISLFARNLGCRREDLFGTEGRRCNQLPDPMRRVTP